MYKYTDETETMVHIVDEDGNSLKSMAPDKVPDGIVVLSLTQTEKDERAILQSNSQERLNLAEIDRKSIRDIRKWMAAQPDASKEIKDYEASALAARARMK
jgi:hypothetical protein